MHARLVILATALVSSLGCRADFALSDAGETDGSELETGDGDGDGDGDPTGDGDPEPAPQMCGGRGGLVDFEPQLLGGIAGASVAFAGDYDGENGLDIRIFGIGTTALVQYDNNGNGIFGSPDGFDYGGFALTADIADLDGDGFLDFVASRDAGDQTYDLVYAPGLAGGDFDTLRVLDDDVGGQVFALEVAQLDDDEQIELVVSPNLESLGYVASVLVYEMGPNDDFLELMTPDPEPVGTEAWGLAVADVDADGIAEIFVADTDEDNQVEGLELIRVLTDSSGINDYKIADMAVVGAGNPRSLLVVPGLAGGTEPILVAAEQVTSLPASTPGQVSLFALDGTSIGERTDIPLGTDPSGLASADINCDGNVDLIVTEQGENRVTILFGPLPDSPYAPLQIDGVEGGPAVLPAVGDFDEDGILDIVVPSYFGSQAWLLWGQ